MLLLHRVQGNRRMSFWTRRSKESGNWELGGQGAVHCTLGLGEIFNLRIKTLAEILNLGPLCQSYRAQLLYTVLHRCHLKNCKSASLLHFLVLDVLELIKLWVQIKVNFFIGSMQCATVCQLC